jgi:hypothetical protein
MIVNKTVEFLNYHTPSYTGTVRTPVFLRSLSDSERGHDTVEISEHARKRFLDNSSSPLEKALLKALPSIEHFREHLRESERDADVRRRERVDMLKSKLLGHHYDMDEVKLAQAAEEMTSQFEGK